MDGVKQISMKDNSKVIIGNEVLFYRQKAPFLRSGKSLEGALEYDPAQDRIRCHECGKWFTYLAPHIKQKHHITSSEYKKKHGLSARAALVGEHLRELKVTRGIFYSYGPDAQERLRLARESPKQRQNLQPVQAIGWSTEKKNLRGTCHAQLLARLKTLTARLGHSPTVRELRQAGIWPYTLCTTFNVYTVNDVYSLLNMESLPESPQKSRRKHTPEILVELLRDFYVKHHRLPGHSDFNRGIIPSPETYRRAFGSLEAAYREAGVGAVHEKQYSSLRLSNSSQALIRVEAIAG